MKFRDLLKKFKFLRRRYILGRIVYLSYEGDHAVITAFSLTRDAFYNLPKDVQQKVLKDCIEYFENKREELRCGQKL